MLSLLSAETLVKQRNDAKNNQAVGCAELRALCTQYCSLRQTVNLASARVS